MHFSFQTEMTNADDILMTFYEMILGIQYLISLNLTQCILIEQSVLKHNQN